VTDSSRFAEWQAGVVGDHMENGAGVSVGSKCMPTRRIGGAERDVTSAVTTLDPAAGLHGIGELLVPRDARERPAAQGTG
jgi:hypothetical protein